MKQFAIAALAAVPTLAQWQWSTLDIKENDEPKPTYIRTTPTSVFDVWGDNAFVESNKAVFIMNENSADIGKVYKPWLIGGSVEYNTNVNQIESGCVSGLYLVKTGPECGMDEQTGEPTCPSIDVLQSNKYDFNMQAHPCINGNCDAASQCSYSMMKDGAEKYGENAYGVNGDIIDTMKEFNVKTEFIADSEYEAVFKIKTTLSQAGRSMELEADCSDSLSGLSYYLGMEMGFVMSHWQDDEGVSGLESNADFVGCKAQSHNMIGAIKTKSWGSTEEKKDGDDGDDGDDDGDQDGETIFTDVVAQQVDDCGNPDCTECVEAYKEFKPDDKFLACKSETQFRYKFKCGKSKDQSLCGADDYCHWSYPMGDPEKFRSSDAACRPIPDKLVFNDFTYADVEWRNPRAGLCRYGCSIGQQCRKSWLPTDSRKGYSSLQRCMFMDA